MNSAQVAVAVLFSVLLSQAQLSRIEVAITEGSRRASVVASATPNVSGAPWAAIPARPLPGRASADCEWFRIRAWAEGDGARVIVFAVNRQPEGDQETQIATYHLQAGESVEVSATPRYGARPVRLEATTAP